MKRDRSLLVLNNQSVFVDFEWILGSLSPAPAPSLLPTPLVLKKNAGSAHRKRGSLPPCRGPEVSAKELIHFHWSDYHASSLFSKNAQINSFLSSFRPPSLLPFHCQSQNVGK